MYKNSGIHQIEIHVEETPTKTHTRNPKRIFKTICKCIYTP